VGYSVHSTDGFFSFHQNHGIDDAYLDGMSVTYGSPRQHIWSFGTGHGPPAYSDFRCPCDTSNRDQAPLPPSFVGNSFFCDGSYNGAVWDGMDCTTTCCTFNSPPWFNVTLLTPTSDDIEVRLCQDQAVDDESTHLRLLNLYVQ
jgi:hypothetical protein